MVNVVMASVDGRAEVDGEEVMGLLGVMVPPSVGSIDSRSYRR
jgi:hypothetical protein